MLLFALDAIVFGDDIAGRFVGQSGSHDPRVDRAHPPEDLSAILVFRLRVESDVEDRRIGAVPFASRNEERVAPGVELQRHLGQRLANRSKDPGSGPRSDFEQAQLTVPVLRGPGLMGRRSQMNRRNPALLVEGTGSYRPRNAGGDGHAADEESSEKFWIERPHELVRLESEASVEPVEHGAGTRCLAVYHDRHGQFPTTTRAFGVVAPKRLEPHESRRYSVTVDGEDWVVVYRGFAVPALDLVQAMLNAEGLEPRRLGQASPALLGIGNFAVEQLIEVPRRHEQAALALLAASLPESIDAAQSEDLETEALNATPPANAAVSLRPGFNAETMALIVVAAILLYLWLR